MKRSFHLAALPLLCSAALASALHAQGPSAETQARLGSLTFREYCRSCHGPEAKGDGPVAQYLKPKPADLTRIAERNDGTFPADDVYAAIEGGKAIKGHGNSEMPVWGDAFRKARGELTDEQIEERIHQLVTYLETLQVGVEQKR